ncbi:DUF427 domain-containing protein [Maritimibacter sp. HL-12]|uniref:DUF427 domain-containing protein n=1 Tax=Maritimibacter sp. HL-12 TaxID=1162418 RepID=UPI000A0F3956|nr:DUF427 domain-containing protein [Maritimibacter sp. HL-12]SMH54077.1 Uncharacterized conserved protein, DUF427 family [Maritimibacter sp. HL-12]
MSETIRIRRIPGKWVVRAGGAVLGESAEVLELSEPGHPDALYFPRRDLAMAMLEASATSTTCPRKGEAHFFAIHTRSTVIEDAGWSFDAPLEAAARIAGHVAFDPGKVTVEEI